MTANRSNLENARFLLEAGFDPDTWTLHIEGKFSLDEIPRLKQLLDIYATLAEPPTAKPASPPQGGTE